MIVQHYRINLHLLPYSCSAPLDPIATDMLTVQMTLPYSNAEIGLKWQVSEISALAELLKALAT